MIHLISKHKFGLSNFKFEDFTCNELLFIKRHCCDKLKFRYIPEVIRKIESIPGFDNVTTFGMYKCKFCNGWHFTSHYSDLQDEELVKILVGRKNRKRRQKLHIRIKLKARGLINDAIPVQIAC